MRWLVFLLLFAPMPAYGFGQDGHKVVCEIALGELSVEAREEVDRLLALDAEYSGYAESCLWADVVRRTTHRKTSAWHYLNLEQDDLVVDMGDCHAARRCVLHGITVHMEVLGDKSASDQNRLEALKFVGHWIGDIHQPMHISFAEDLGGNKIKVRWLERKNTNLHSVWDSQIILTHLRETWRSTKAADRWVVLARTLAEDITDEDRQAWPGSTSIAWAQESYDITRNASVGYVGASEDVIYTLDRAYHLQHFPTVSLRLKQAGIRLGEALNQALGN